jgi:hypothetical protein
VVDPGKIRYDEKEPEHKSEAGSGTRALLAQREEERCQTAPRQHAKVKRRERKGQ